MGDSERGVAEGGDPFVIGLENGGQTAGGELVVTESGSAVLHEEPRTNGAAFGGLLEDFDLMSLRVSKIPQQMRPPHHNRLRRPARCDGSIFFPKDWDKRLRMTWLSI